MRPFEPFEKRRPRTRDELLLKRLEDSKRQPQAEEPALVKAYRKTRASDTHYPNSAELLRAVIGAENLSGGITEICSKKRKCLSEAWLNTNVKIACTSWRKEIHSEGILACPDDLQSSWLFSMDPMSYSENGDEDDNKLHCSDLERVVDALKGYFESGQPGIACLFVYGVRKNQNREQHYRNFVEDLKEQVADNITAPVELTTSYFSLQHSRGNRNIAGLIHSSQIDLASKLRSACIDIGLE